MAKQYDSKKIEQAIALFERIEEKSLLDCNAATDKVWKAFHHGHSRGVYDAMMIIRRCEVKGDGL